MSHPDTTMKAAEILLATASQDRAQAVLFPPLVGLALLLAGIALQVFFPLSITSFATVVSVTGGIVLAAGIGLQIVCLRTFKRAMTTPLFKKPTTNIVQSGPYARSRNPIYIAVFIQLLGWALLLNTWWLIAMAPILYLYIRVGVIAREEQYLERKFGDEYHKYQSRVPRWL